jgi:hypothetical protein
MLDVAAAALANPGSRRRPTSFRVPSGVAMNAFGRACALRALLCVAESTLLTSTNPGDRCVATYAFDVRGDVLRLHALDPCKDNDGPDNTSLFASFPYTK